jgi:hypothetical protein
VRGLTLDEEGRSSLRGSPAEGERYRAMSASSLLSADAATRQKPTERKTTMSQMARAAISMVEADVTKRSGTILTPPSDKHAQTDGNPRYLRAEVNAVFDRRRSCPSVRGVQRADDKRHRSQARLDEKLKKKRPDLQWQ